MAVVCVIALCLRILAHRSNRANQAYFNSFARSVVKHLEEEEVKRETVADVDIWLENLLSAVKDHLPDRSLRFKKQAGARSEKLIDYTDGKQSIVIAMRQQADALKSPHLPNCAEFADRVLNQDNNWRTVLGFLPIDVLNRGLDILPNLYVIGGIFGTFVGITSALPLIATIDITNLAEAAPILNHFVAVVAHSMNTSIAGISFSVIMTLITALFPLTTIRDEVAKNFERAIEFMWYRIHGSKLTHAEIQVIQSLGRLNSDLVSVLKEISADLRESRDKENAPTKFKKGA
jgi:hypothetical protein